MSDVSETGEAFDVHGRRIEIGRDSGAVYLDLALGGRYLFEGRELENLREAVDRAAMPGQRVKHGPACNCTPCLAEPGYRVRREVSDGG